MHFIHLGWGQNIFKNCLILWSKTKSFKIKLHDLRESQA